jgi:antitoxin MazE6
VACRGSRSSPVPAVKPIMRRERVADLGSRLPKPGFETGLGYTIGMKTAVSIPDEVFHRVERFAQRAGRSRSEVFSAALQEYVARHAPDEVTEAMNRVCIDLADQPDVFVRTAGHRVLERTEW